MIPLVMLVLIALYFVETLSYAPQEDVGPAGVPYMWMLFCSAFCLFLVVMALLRKGKPDPVAGRVGFVVIVLLWLSLYLIAIQTVGYFVSSFVFLAVSMYGLGYRRLPVMGLVAVGWLVFSYVIFSRLLYIPLPVGPLLKPLLG